MKIGGRRSVFPGSRLRENIQLFADRLVYVWPHQDSLQAADFLIDWK
jgi:hypothetical protein